MRLKITRGLVHVQNNLPLTYSNPDNILCGHTFSLQQGWLLQILILLLDHQLVERFTPISSWILMNLRTMLFLYIILIFECCT